MNSTSSQTCDQVYRYRVSAQWSENRAASAGLRSSHQEWGRAHEGATRGQREYRRVTPFDLAVGMHACVIGEIAD